jgi:hypothetical protein
MTSVFRGPAFASAFMTTLLSLSPGGLGCGAADTASSTDTSSGPQGSDGSSADPSSSGSGGPGVSTSGSSGPDVPTSGSGDPDVSTSEPVDPPDCPGECTPDEVEQKDCPWSEPATRTCSARCTWGEFSACEAPTGWRPMADSSTANIPARREHTAVWTGSVMLVFGGNGGDSAPGAYDPVTDIWTKLAPSPASGHAVWTGSELVVVATDKFDEELGATFDPASNTWTPHANLYPLGQREDFAFGVWMPTTQEVLVWGGSTINCPCYHNDGAALDVKLGTWRIVAKSPLQPRDGFRPPGAVWNGSRVVIYGGGSYGGDDYTDAATYDPVTDTWEPIPQSPQSGYTDLASLAVGGSGELAAFWGGRLLNAYPAKDGAIWDDAANTWSSIPAIPSGGIYDAHIEGASWTTGPSFGLWGGLRFDNGFHLVDTGYTYDVAAKTWTELPSGGPSARSGVVAVWTGTDVIVWGGEADDGLQSSGKIYRP